MCVHFRANLQCLVAVFSENEEFSAISGEEQPQASCWEPQLESNIVEKDLGLLGLLSREERTQGRSYHPLRLSQKRS